MKRNLLYVTLVVLILAAGVNLKCSLDSRDKQPIPKYRPHNSQTLYYWYQDSAFQSELEWRRSDELHDLFDSCVRYESLYYSGEADWKTLDSFRVVMHEAYKMLYIK